MATKVLKDFSSSQYTDSELSVKASHVLENMTGNTNYPTPDPTLNSVKEANDNYIASLKLVEDGSKKFTVQKNNLRAALELLLKQLSDYVLKASNGDEAIILSSGFDIYKKPTTVGPLPKPTKLTVKPGNNKGSVIVTCDVVVNASFYEFEYTDAPATAVSVWILKTSTKHVLLLEGLISGKQYTFRVAAGGTDSSRIWSDETSSFVL